MSVISSSGRHHALSSFAMSDRLERFDRHIAEVLSKFPGHATTVRNTRPEQLHKQSRGHIELVTIHGCKLSGISGLFQRDLNKPGLFARLAGFPLIVRQTGSYSAVRYAATLGWLVFLSLDGC